ncbi:MAG: SWIM zinc finger family protein [Bacteroidetes bacterium]|nr:SWIM zinc finger family protein [Bacteroidota bacterium]
MQCSCPDWAVPCKHLAAVIYKISAEIDNNPFWYLNYIA